MAGPRRLRPLIGVGALATLLFLVPFRCTSATEAATAAADPSSPAAPAQVAAPPAAGPVDAETKCLALAVYWEGKDETQEGQAAIAHTVLNRAKSGEFPDTVCGVIAQGAGDPKLACQFSWWCDGKRDEPQDREAWEKAVEAARAARREGSRDPTGGALFFYSGDTPPAWASEKKRLARIGKHIFYR